MSTHTLQNVKLEGGEMNLTNPESRPVALLTAKELGQQIGMSVSSIYRRRSLGEPLPRAIKIGSRVRWTQASVDEFIEQQMEPAND